MQFIQLPSGKIINLDAVAFIQVGEKNQDISLLRFTSGDSLGLPNEPDGNALLKHIRTLPNFSNPS